MKCVQTCRRKLRLLGITLLKMFNGFKTPSWRKSYFKNWKNLLTTAYITSYIGGDPPEHCWIAVRVQWRWMHNGLFFTELLSESADLRPRKCERYWANCTGFLCRQWTSITTRNKLPGFVLLDKGQLDVSFYHRLDYKINKTWTISVIGPNQSCVGDRPCIFAKWVNRNVTERLNISVWPHRALCIQRTLVTLSAKRKTTKSSAAQLGWETNHHTNFSATFTLVYGTKNRELLKTVNAPTSN